MVQESDASSMLAAAKSPLPPLPPPLPPSSSSQLTAHVILSSYLAGTAGLMYGYDLVVAGGVSIMEGFLATFFPHVLAAERSVIPDNYCKYDSQLLQFYCSSPCISAILVSYLAGHITRTRGHKVTLLWAGLCYIANAVLAAAAQNLTMLFLSRVLLGIGLGFAGQASGYYISEISPARHRGALNFLFSINVAIGTFAGSVINYLTSHYEPWGWRVSLGIEGIPAVLLTIAGLVVPDSPIYLIHMGKEEQAKRNLTTLRGCQDIDAEFRELVRAKEEATGKQNTRLFQLCYTPQVVMASLAFPFFQQVSGNDAIMFYGPFLFAAAGLGSKAALYSGIFTGAAVFVGTFAAAFSVDKVGRRTILVMASFMMFVSIFIVGCLFAIGMRGHTTSLSREATIVELAMVCLYVGSYRASWGPLAWIVPSEILPQEIRSSALSMTVFVNNFMRFLIGQTLLSMLCAFKYGMFFFFAGWVALMGAFIYLFQPETKGVPMDRFQELWKQHWFWSYFVREEKSERPKI